MTARTATLRERLRGQDLAAPELIDLEVVSVLRRQLAVGKLDTRRALLALDDPLDLPVQRAPHRALPRRCWELRYNLSVYDAAYVALAEALDTLLVTADARLANAVGVKCTVEVLSARSDP
jgi:predicted nucleic acid-binding protein